MTVTPEQALEDLLDFGYGATRDITFTPVTREALVSFLNVLAEDFRLESAYDIDGKDIAAFLTERNFDAVFENSYGYVRAELSSARSIIQFLRLFVDWNPNEPSYGLEVSFFPADVVTARFTLHGFLKMLDVWNGKLQADDYFVRYENASWKPYDSSDRSVIFTRKLPPQP